VCRIVRVRVQLLQQQVDQDERGELARFSGSTAIVAIVYPIPQPALSSSAVPLTPPLGASVGIRLVVANVGDCRAVLSHNGTAVALSVDQVPSRPDEHQRIIVRARARWVWGERLHPLTCLGASLLQNCGGWIRNGRLQGVLAVSRAFGDVEHKWLKDKCWDKSFSGDLVIAEPVRTELARRAPLHSPALFVPCLRRRFACMTSRLATSLLSSRAMACGRSCRHRRRLTLCAGS
jgi:serine/threonine protein phosphatase PrpC